MNHLAWYSFLHVSWVWSSYFALTGLCVHRIWKIFGHYFLDIISVSLPPCLLSFGHKKGSHSSRRLCEICFHLSAILHIFACSMLNAALSPSPLVSYTAFFILDITVFVSRDSMCLFIKYVRFDQPFQHTECSYELVLKSFPLFSHVGEFQVCFAD